MASLNEIPIYEEEMETIFADYRNETLWKEEKKKMMEGWKGWRTLAEAKGG